MSGMFHGGFAPPKRLKTIALRYRNKTNVMASGILRSRLNSSCLIFDKASWAKDALLANSPFLIISSKVEKSLILILTTGLGQKKNNEGVMPNSSFNKISQF